MKKTCISLLLLIFVVTVQAGNGTKESPFTVAEAIKSKNTTTQFWIKGYVVGEMKEYSNKKYFYELTPPFPGTTSLLIANTPNELDISKCLPIQSGDLAPDLWENPEVWRKEVLFAGLTKEYYGMPGVKSLTEFEVLTPAPLYNEAAEWTFYEDFDDKTYVPTSSEHTFAGGTYTGELASWTFKGATWGDTGKDQKWNRAAARIRLTDGPTGDPGYIEINENKSNGIGYVRFWAGNYEEDTSGGALALFISNDNGVSWNRVAHSQNIVRKWQEYEFVVNTPGELRLRIAKDENSSKGINVDKLRMSNYYNVHTSTLTNKSANISWLSAEGGIRVFLGDKQSLLSIYSATGQLISSGTYSREQFFALAAGIYILKADDTVLKCIVR